MAVATRPPQQDYAFDLTGTWSGTSGSRYALVNDYPDASGVSYLECTAAGRITFTRGDLFSLPADATDIVVRLKYYDQKVGTGAASLRSQFALGSYHPATAHSPANGVWTQRTDEWSSNPITGSPWTVADLNSGGATSSFGFDVVTATAPVRVASLQLEVEYTPPDGPSGTRQVIKAASAGTSTTTNDNGDEAYADKLTVSFEAASGAKYLVFWSAEVAQSSASGLVRAWVYAANAAGGWDFESFGTDIRPKDTTNWYSVFGGYLHGGYYDSLGTIDVTLRFAREGGVGTASIRNARIAIIKLGPFDLAYFDNSTMDVNETTYGWNGEFWIDPPEQSDYLIGWLGALYFADTTARAGVKGVVAGTDFGETYGVAGLDEVEWLPFAALTKVSLTDSAQVLLQSKVLSSDHEAGVAGPIGFALRFDDFDDWDWGSSDSEASRTANSYGSVLDLTHGMLRGNYLGLFAGIGRAGSTSSDQYVEARADGTQIAEANWEARSTSSPYARHSFFTLWFGDDQDEGLKTFDIRQKAESNGTSQWLQGPRIALLGYDVVTAIAVDVTGPAEALTMVEAGGGAIVGHGAVVAGAGEALGLVEAGGGVIAGAGVEILGTADNLAVVEAGGSVIAGLGVDLAGAADGLELVETGGNVVTHFPGELEGPADALTFAEAAGPLIAGHGLIVAGPADVLPMIETGGGLTIGAGAIAQAAAELLTLVEAGGPLTIGLGVDLAGAADLLALVEAGGALIAGRGVDLDGAADVLTVGEAAGAVIAGHGLLVAGPAEPVSLVEAGGPLTIGLGVDLSGAADVLTVVETGGTVSAVRVVDLTGAGEALGLVEAGGGVVAGFGVDLAGPADRLVLVETGGMTWTGAGVIRTGPADRLTLVEANGPFTAFNPNRAAPRWRTWTASYENRTFRSLTPY